MIIRVIRENRGSMFLCGFARDLIFQTLADKSPVHLMSVCLKMFGNKVALGREISIFGNLNFCYSPAAQAAGALVLKCAMNGPDCSRSLTIVMLLRWVARAL